MFVLDYLWSFVVQTQVVRSASFHVMATSLETLVLYGLFSLLDLGIVQGNRLKVLIKSDNSKKAYMEAWIMSLKNLIYLWIALPIVTYILTGDIHGNYTIQGIEQNRWPEEAPGFVKFVLELGLIILCVDFCMYWIHRAYHWGPLYKYFHSIHHEFHDTISVHAMCIHVVELYSVVPVLFLVPRLAYEIFGLHPLAVYVAPYFLTLHGVLEHCGYDDYIEYLTFGFVTGSKMHMVHHQRSRYNYGFYTYLWDYIFHSKLTHDDMLLNQRTPQHEHCENDQDSLHGGRD